MSTFHIDQSPSKHAIYQTKTQKGFLALLYSFCHFHCLLKCCSNFTVTVSLSVAVTVSVSVQVTATFTVPVTVSVNATVFVRVTISDTVTVDVCHSL